MLCHLRRPRGPHSKWLLGPWKIDFESFGETLPLLQLSGCWKKKTSTTHENQIHPVEKSFPTETNKPSAEMDAGIWTEWERWGDCDPPPPGSLEDGGKHAVIGNTMRCRTQIWPLCLFLSSIWFSFASSEALWYFHFVLVFFHCLSPRCRWCESCLHRQFHNIIISRRFMAVHSAVSQLVDRGPKVVRTSQSWFDWNF